MRSSRAVVSHLLIVLVWFANTACAQEPNLRQADIYFSAHFPKIEQPSQQLLPLEVTIRVVQDSSAIRAIDFNLQSGNFTPVSLTATDNRAVWQVPASGGETKFHAILQHNDQGLSKQQWTKDWVITRLERIFPAARVRSIAGAHTTSYLKITGPKEWHFETSYGPLEAQYQQIPSLRTYQRPGGMLIAGQLGIRRENIAGTKVAVAAPIGSGFRRLDTLAFLQWTYPTLLSKTQHKPDRLLIVGAPTNMWRGGSSAPNSLYISSNRPLISENATSTLLHELMHVAGLHSANTGDDWIVEGLAEYYSLRLLFESATISNNRFEGALEKLKAWSNSSNASLSDPSTGADTAAAVMLFHNLHLELKMADSHIDQVLYQLLLAPEISAATLNNIVSDLLNRPSEVLSNHL